MVLGPLTSQSSGFPNQVLSPTACLIGLLCNKQYEIALDEYEIFILAQYDIL